LGKLVYHTCRAWIVRNIGKSCIQRLEHLTAYPSKPVFPGFNSTPVDSAALVSPVLSYNTQCRKESHNIRTGTSILGRDVFC
jgi:hypothetical protein